MGAKPLPEPVDDGFAMRIYEANRESAIEFYKTLASGGRNKVPPQMLEEDEKFVGIDAAEMRRKQIVLEMAKMADPPSDFYASASRLCMAAFLLDRTRKIRDLCRKDGSSGLFSLYLSLRAQVVSMLEGDYYSRPTDRILDEFIELEPLISAISELCGLKEVDLTEAMVEFNRNLADELDSAV